MVKLSFQVIRNTQVPSIVCSYENNRYIFNVPDGFQRFIREHKVRIQPAPIFLFTRLETTTLNGLFGYLQTLIGDNNAFGSKLYGPKGLAKLMNVMKYNDVGGYKTLPYAIQEFFDGEFILGTKDLKILDELFLNKQNDCKLQAELEKIKEHIVNPKDCNKASIYLKSSKVFQDANLTITALQTGNAIQYFIESRLQKGGISKEKLAKFNVPQNKMKDIMKLGKATLEDGSEVTIEQLRDEDIPSQSCLILDIQNEDEFNQMMKNEDYIELIKKANNNEINLIAIIHLGNIYFEQYSNYIAQNSKFNHILANYKDQKYDNSFQLSCQLFTNQLNQKYPNYFPNIQSTQINNIPQQLQQQKNVFGYAPQYEFNLLPLKMQGFKQIINYEIQQLPQQQQQQQQIEQNEQILQNNELKLIFLGTSSMKPGRYRNVSGNLIYGNKFSIILDCGEGTWKQIEDQQLDLFNKPLLIWISHAHSDHHIGIFTILDEYCKNSKQFCEIYLIIPSILVPWIVYYQQLVHNNFNYRLIITQSFELSKDDVQLYLQGAFHSQRLRYGPQVDNIKEINFEQNYQDLLSSLNKFNLKTLQVCQVEHCPQSYGLRLEFINGRCLTYSGDTRPCKEFCKLTQNADIMIHEATYTDDLQQNAETNMHSTISEAINIGIQSKSNLIALTHFSQRYKRIDVDQIEHLKNINHVVFGYDHMGYNIDKMIELSQVSKEILLSLDE